MPWEYWFVGYRPDFLSFYGEGDAASLTILPSRKIFARLICFGQIIPTELYRGNQAAKEPKRREPFAVFF
jgi:hypothetical protein